MGTKRIGLARTQALIQGLKRELALGGAAASGLKRSIEAKTSAYAVVCPEDSGKIFTTKGASGSVTFTLPAAAGNDGCYLTIVGGANHNVVVTGTDEQITTLNDITADSVAASTSSKKIGSQFECYCDGSTWFVVGVTVGSTYTVTSA